MALRAVADACISAQAAVLRLSDYDYEHRYEAIRKLTETMVSVITTSRTKLAPLLEPTPGTKPSLPDGMTLTDVLDFSGGAWENTLFFADVVLHFPDMTHRIVDRKKVVAPAYKASRGH